MLLTSTLCLISKRAKHSEGFKEVFLPLSFLKWFYVRQLAHLIQVDISTVVHVFPPFSVKQRLCFKANNTYLPFPHFAHNWHSLSSAAFGVFSRSFAACIPPISRSWTKTLFFTWTGSPHLAVKTLRGEALTHAQWDGCGPEGRDQAVGVGFSRIS